MRCILTSIHTPNIKPLSDISWYKNKLLYAKTHGYYALAKTNNFYNIPIGFEKIAFLRDLFFIAEHCDWIWWTGSDSLVMNHTISIEQKISEINDPTKHIIMTGDFNYKINCDSILLRVSQQSFSWLNDILNNGQSYFNHMFAEQQFMLDTFDKYSDIIKLMPQYFMNVYDNKHYGMTDGVSNAAKDVSGNRGIYETGDWLIHFPGTGWENRMALVNEYYGKVIYRK